MNKREFNTLHKICRDSWNLIHKRNMDEKPEELDVFQCQCPACDLADRARELSYHISRCRFCPIDRWRSVSITTNTSFAACENNGEAYDRWQYDGKSKDGNEAAKEIANLEWSFLPIYGDVIIPESLLKVKINAKTR
jgi:hypothetical protein